MKKQTFFLGFAAIFSLFFMSFRPATSIENIAKPIESNKSLDNKTIAKDKSITLVGWLAMTVAESTLTALLLDGAESNYKMGVVENKDYTKKISQIKMRRLDQKK